MFGELMRWNPSEELPSWHRDIDDLFGRFFGRLNLRWAAGCPEWRHTGKRTNVRIDLPGVDPKDVVVHAEGNHLSVTGERKTEETGPEDSRSDLGTEH